MLYVTKRNNESATSLMYRFNKRVKQSGLVKEVRKRRFTDRAVSRLKRKESAIHRDAMKKEFLKKKKMGLVNPLR